MAGWRRSQSLRQARPAAVNSLCATAAIPPRASFEGKDELQRAQPDVPRRYLGGPGPRPTNPEEPSVARVALSKSDLESSVGMELLSMCQSVTADGSLDNQEIAELARWVQRNKDSSLPAVAFLRPIVEEIIRDRKVTPEERAELYKVIERVLPPELRTIAQMRKKEAASRAKAAERTAREANSPLEEFDFMVAGTLYEGRLDVIRMHVRPAMDLLVFREPSNPFSRNACQLHAARGAMIGFVPEVDAEELAALLDSGCKYRARVKKVINGSKGPLPVVTIDVFPSSCTLTDVRIAETIRSQTSSRPKPVNAQSEPYLPPRPGFLARLWKALSGSK